MCGGVQSMEEILGRLDQHIQRLGAPVQPASLVTTMRLFFVIAAALALLAGVALLLTHGFQSSRGPSDSGMTDAQFSELRVGDNLAAVVVKAGAPTLKIPISRAPVKPPSPECALRTSSVAIYYRRSPALSFYIFLDSRDRVQCVGSGAFAMAY
jgi:hypothetical protein